MNFSELHILVEGFKEKRDLWIKQGNDPQIVDMVISHFKTLKLRNILPLDKVDIDKYKEFNELWQTVTEYEQKKSKSQLKKEAKVNGAKIVFENDDWICYQVFTYEASKLLGRETKWCISSNDTDKHFNDYIMKHNIYICIKKQYPRSKIAILLSETGEILAYDSADENIYLSHKMIDIVEKYFKYPDFKIENYITGKLTKNADGSYDVEGDVDFHNVRFKGGKLPIVFNKVSGMFNVGGCRLTSLEGSPRYCNRFECDRNLLESLEGGPDEVGESYSCNNNYLTNLKGMPSEMFNVTYINVGSNNLTTLEGVTFPPRMYFFGCWNNKLTNLKGGPELFVENYDCKNNNLTTLEGAPEEGQEFYC